VTRCFETHNSEMILASQLKEIRIRRRTAPESVRFDQVVVFGIRRTRREREARYEGKNREDDTLRITDEDFRAFWKKHPWEVPLHRLSHDGLLWFCSIMFDVPPNHYLLRRSIG
jgi:hypothetical protein